MNPDTPSQAHISVILAQKGAHGYKNNALSQARIYVILSRKRLRGGTAACWQPDLVLQEVYVQESLRGEERVGFVLRGQSHKSFVKWEFRMF